MPEITPGRRLRLDRRKAGLDQKGLASLLGVTLEEVSAMENDRQPLTAKAQTFVANTPSRVPTGKATRPAKPAEPTPGLPEPPEPELGAESHDGPGPRVEPTDSPPRPGPSKHKDLVPSRGEIAELEDALLKLFAGEAFLIPRTQPDGSVTQVEAVIPGIAQVVGMADEFDGKIISTYAPGMAKAWAELARENATVRKVLMGLTYGGAYRGVLAATLPALLAIVAHHGLVPIGGGPHRVVEHPPVNAVTVADLDEEIARLQEVRFRMGENGGGVAE